MDIVPQNIPLKQCVGPCRRFLPATTDYFHRHRQQRNGLHPRCKECRSVERKALYTLPEEQEKAHKRAKRYIEANREKVNAQKKEYYKTHKERAKAYHQAHREERLAYDKMWHVKHREERSEYDKKRYDADPEKHRQYSRDYAKAHPLWNRRNAHIRRMRKHNSGGHYKPAQIEEQLKRQKYTCYYARCGHVKFKQEHGKYIYHIDHIIPLSRGGSNDISNIVLACPSCNESKHDKLLHEWGDGGRLL